MLLTNDSSCCPAVMDEVRSFTETSNRYTWVRRGRDMWVIYCCRVRQQEEYIVISWTWVHPNNLILHMLTCMRHSSELLYSIVLWYAISAEWIIRVNHKRDFKGGVCLCFHMALKESSVLKACAMYMYMYNISFSCRLLHKPLSIVMHRCSVL